MLVNKVYRMTQKGGGFVFSLLLPVKLNQHQPLVLHTLKQSNSGNLTSISARVCASLKDDSRSWSTDARVT